MGNIFETIKLEIESRKMLDEYYRNMGRARREAGQTKFLSKIIDKNIDDQPTENSDTIDTVFDHIVNGTDTPNPEPSAASNAEVSVKGSETEIPSNPNYKSDEKKKEEPTSESVEAASAAIPRVEDTHISGDRPADFSGLFEKNQKSKERMPDLIKAVRTLPQAEKDLPPEERSIQSCVINYMMDGAVNPQNFDPRFIPQYNFQMYPDQNMYPNPYIYDASGIAVPQQQQQVQPLPVDFGKFKVDNPQPQKPKVEKAEPDKVEGVEQISDMVEGATEALGVEDTKKRAECTVLQEAPKTSSKSIPNEINPTMQSNNQELIKKYWWLEGIEKAANKNGCLVTFNEGVSLDGKPNGIMYVYTFTKNVNDVYVFNQCKSFIIDYGKIFYDGRLKAFLTTDLNEITYRMLNGFEIIDNSEKNVKKWKEDFLNTIFKAGTMAIDPRSGLYTEKLRQLNVFVDQGSQPTNKMNNKDNDRQNARNRLFNSIDAGIFVHAKSYDPNCRFAYYDFDTHSKVFLIVNNATQTPIAILYTPECATVLCGDIQDSINKFEEAKKKFRADKKKNG